MNNQLAFPLIEPIHSGDTVHTGMTLRDYFAAQAVQAQINGDIGYAYPDKLKAIAEISYRMADAMMEARNAP